MRDLDVRRALLAFLHAEHGHEIETLILEELGILEGSIRVDLAVVNGSLNAYEIKSDSDTLERLHAQAEAYNRVFDTVTLVAAGRHITPALGLVPKWWGITEASIGDNGQILLMERRCPGRNPKVDPAAVAQLLWRDEALAILEEHGVAAGVRGKPRRIAWSRLATTLSSSEIGAAVRTYLKRRESWRDRSRRMQDGDWSRSFAT